MGIENFRKEKQKVHRSILALRKHFAKLKHVTILNQDRSDDMTDVENIDSNHVEESDNIGIDIVGQTIDSTDLEDDEKESHDVVGDDPGSDSDFEPDEEELANDDDENDTFQSHSLQHVLELKIKKWFDLLNLAEHLVRTQDYTAARLSTASTRTAKYLAYALSKVSWTLDIQNLRKKNLRKILYQKDNFVFDYCDYLTATKSLKPGSIVNILLDIHLVAEWLHFFAKIEFAKDCKAPWEKFVMTLKTCKALWHKRSKRLRRECTKSLEELVTEGKLPPNGLKDFQKIVKDNIPKAMAKVHAFLKAKVIANRIVYVFNSFLKYVQRTNLLIID